MSLLNPDWSDYNDRKLYDELFYCRERKILTPEEENFVTKMYHIEEQVSNLDGERYYDESAQFN